MLRKLAMMAGCLALVTIGLVTSENAGQPPTKALAQSASQSQSAQPAQASAAADVPAYHDKPSKDPLPATIDPLLFPDVMNQNIYALAAKEKKILYQQPCYCRCDREVGHHSLLDCYVDRHASVCSTCKMEAVFAYQEMKKGKTAAEIRQEIMDNKWQKVDLSPYAVAGAVKPDGK